MSGYFSIHGHTDYSNAALGFSDSTNRVEKSVDYALEIGLTGITLTEHEFLGSHIRLMKYRDKLESEGKITHDSFTFAFGNEVYFVEEHGPREKYYHHILIAKDKKGHEVLRKLSSRAWENSFTDRGIKRTPSVMYEVKEIMEKEKGKGHIISSTACLGGYIDQAFLRIKIEEEKLVPDQNKILQEKQNIVDFVEWNKEVFGEDNFYLEIAPNTSEEQRYVNRRYKALSKAVNVPLIFSVDAHYLNSEEREIHKAYLNSGEGDREVDAFYSTAYYMTLPEVRSFFLLDFEEEEFYEMVRNLEKLRSSIEHYSLLQDQQVPHLPVTPPSLDSFFDDFDLSAYESIQEMLSSKSKQNLYWIRTCLNELHKRDLLSDRYIKQIDTEAKILLDVSADLKQDVSSYYNLTQKIIEIIWNEGDSLVGTSRGSALAFLSNYLLNITQIDPIPYVGDKSWRHLDKDRPELPEHYWALNVNLARGCY